MSTQPNAAAPFIPPELRDVLQAFRREIFSSLRCAMPGIIQTFDPVTQTATIQVAMQMTVGDQVKDYPLLVDCPVAILSGGTAYLTFPIQPGDTCLVLFCDRAIDAWFTTGNVLPPAQQRQHSLADGIALVGIRHLANALSNYDATGIGLN
ncbi:MAG: Gp138 family membrane-puncturing spike protein, partial [Polyangia bacterium]